MDKSKASELNADIRKTVEQLANETDAARQSELFRTYLKTGGLLGLFLAQPDVDLAAEARR